MATAKKRFQARQTRRVVTPMGREVVYAPRHVILKDLRGAEEKGRFAEAVYFAKELHGHAERLVRYFEGGTGGPSTAYEAQRALDRVLSALEFVMGARHARRSAVAVKKTKKRAA